jgi:colicin import membrane protein
MTARWCVLLLVFWTHGLSAQPASDRLSEIQMERESWSTALDQQEAACSTRFAVTDCVNAVRKRRRELLVPLQQEENQLHLLERRKRNIERQPVQQNAPASLSTPQAPLDKVAIESQQAAKRIAEKTKNHQAQAQERASMSATVRSHVSAEARDADANREAFAKKAAASLKRQQDRDEKLRNRPAPPNPLPLPP